MLSIYYVRFWKDQGMFFHRITDNYSRSQRHLFYFLLLFQECSIFVTPGKSSTRDKNSVNGMIYGLAILPAVIPSIYK